MKFKTIAITLETGGKLILETNELGQSGFTMKANDGRVLGHSEVSEDQLAVFRSFLGVNAERDTIRDPRPGDRFRIPTAEIEVKSLTTDEIEYSLRESGKCKRSDFENVLKLRGFEPVYDR